MLRSNLSPKKLQEYRDQINKLVIVIIVCFFLYFIAVLFFSQTYSYGRSLPSHCSQEAIKKLNARGLSWKTTVEITSKAGRDTCSYRFEWIDRKWYRL